MSAFGRDTLLILLAIALEPEACFSKPKSKGKKAAESLEDQYDEQYEQCDLFAPNGKTTQAQVIALLENILDTNGHQTILSVLPGSHTASIPRAVGRRTGALDVDKEDEEWLPCQKVAWQIGSAASIWEVLAGRFLPTTATRIASNTVVADAAWPLLLLLVKAWQQESESILSSRGELDAIV